MKELHYENIHKKYDIEQIEKKINDPFQKYIQENGELNTKKLSRDQKKWIKNYTNSTRYREILNGELQFEQTSHLLITESISDNGETLNAFSSPVQMNIQTNTGIIQQNGIEYVIYFQGINLFAHMTRKLTETKKNGGYLNKTMVNEIQENLKQNNKIMKNTYFINQESFAQQFFDNNLATIKDFKQENLIDNLLTKITPIYDATQNTIEKSKSQKKLNEDIINKSYKTQQITNKHKLKNITQTRRNNLNYGRTHIINRPTQISTEDNKKVKISGSYYLRNQQKTGDEYASTQDKEYDNALEEYIQQANQDKTIIDKILKKEIQINKGDIVLVHPIPSLTIAVHEYGHKLVDGNYHLLESTRLLLNSFLNGNQKKVISALKKENTRNPETKKKVDYIYSLSEVYANIIVLKYLIDMFDIADPMEEEIQIQHIIKLAKISKQLPDGPTKKAIESSFNNLTNLLFYDEFDQINLKKKFGKKAKQEIELLMNCIAKNNKTNNNNQSES